MEDQEFTISDIADITSAINYYYRLGSMLTQLGKKEYEGEMRVLYDTLVKYSQNKKHIDYVSLCYWNNIDIHYTTQTWGNTSGGWEGIGGSAMTNRRTLVLHNRVLKFIAVFYGGKLAYIAKDNEKLDQYKINFFVTLPGMISAKHKLDLIFSDK